MNDILADIKVPAVDKCYQFLIPEVMTVAKAIELIASAVAEEDKHFVFDAPSLVLCDEQKGTIIADNLTLESAGLKNGASLILV